jgi:hypothetical protein
VEKPAHSPCLVQLCMFVCCSLGSAAFGSLCGPPCGIPAQTDHSCCHVIRCRLVARQLANMQQGVLATHLGPYLRQHTAQQLLQRLQAQQVLQDCSRASAALSMLPAAWSVAGLGSGYCQRRQC